MKMLSVMLTTLVLLCGNAQAEGERFGWDDGHFLLQMCESTSPSDSAYCHGYIVGVLDVHAEMPRLEMSGGKFKSCLPPDASKDRVKSTVTQFLQNHPDKLQFSAPEVVLLAIQTAFPC